MVWEGQLTVGTTEVLDSEVRGFLTNLDSTLTGNLSPSTFNYAGTDYSVTHLAVYEDLQFLILHMVNQNEKARRDIFATSNSGSNWA